ncbi:leucine-rich repeat-containing protein 18-like isoform X1 [Pseudochaenichthys georgianus]|uniref:leucine-rich repeat-containing protein 18 isoform X1 n=2 Tax=Pseudochaenichthys georgianus TaxID=52239 RepID=UPI00146F7072|nr:leucine-rich repeat-containing protein 18-like isoform X1 [Pseudochaenichthys georgianus]XP_033963840.1 leucine-rich repeat-containing protein 18-like isoform X1 [Pseudochaenichthys georgianus]
MLFQVTLSLSLKSSVRVHPVQTASLPCVSCSTMAKGNKRKAAKSKTITLKVAKECLQLTLDGKLRLNLSFKGVSVMPKCLPKLCEVEEVDLSRNLIRKIPDFIDYFISLRLLDLHSNYLEELPASVGRLQNLLVLNLCNNRLSSLPSAMGLLKKLLTLSLGMNQLSNLPSSISALQELRHIGLSDNKFTSVPFCISRMDKLERVNLDRNPIVTEDTSNQSVATEKLCLVKGGILCGDCLNKCQTDRETMEDNENWSETK